MKPARVGPVPCIRLFSESLLMNRGSAFAPDYDDVKQPVLRLNFAYEGVEVRSAAENSEFDLPVE